MKRLTLLLVLMMALSVGGKNFAFSNQAAAAGAPRKGLGAQHQINALDKRIIVAKKDCVPPVRLTRLK